MATRPEVTAGKAFVIIEAIDRTAMTLQRIQQRLANWVNKMQQVGTIMLKVGIAAMLPIGMGVSQFAAYDQKIRRMATFLDSTTGDIQARLQAFDTSLTSMARTYGVRLEDLSDSLIKILSAGIDPNSAVAVLEQSLKGSIAAGADLLTTTDAVMSLFTSYGGDLQNIAKLTDTMFAIDIRGRIDFEEMAAQIGKVTSVAKAAGLSIEEMGAALGTMTETMPTDIAVTALKNMMAETLQGGTKKGNEAMAKYGMTLDSTTLRAIGLVGILQRIKDTVGITDAQKMQDLAQIFPDTRGLIGVLKLYQELDKYQSNIALQQSSGGLTDRAFANTGKALSRFLQSALEGLKAIGREAGATAAPAIEYLTQKWNLLVTGLINFIDKHRDAVATIITFAAGLVVAGGAIIGVSLALRLLLFALNPVIYLLRGMAILIKLLSLPILAARFLLVSVATLAWRSTLAVTNSAIRIFLFLFTQLKWVFVAIIPAMQIFRAMLTGVAHSLTYVRSVMILVQGAMYVSVRLLFLLVQALALVSLQAVLFSIQGIRALIWGFANIGTVARAAGMFLMTGFVRALTYMSGVAAHLTYVLSVLIHSVLYGVTSFNYLIRTFTLCSALAQAAYYAFLYFQGVMGASSLYTYAYAAAVFALTVTLNACILTMDALGVLGGVILGVYRALRTGAVFVAIATWAWNTAIIAITATKRAFLALISLSFWKMVAWRAGVLAIRLAVLAWNAVLLTCRGVMVLYNAAIQATVVMQQLLYRAVHMTTTVMGWMRAAATGLASTLWKLMNPVTFLLEALKWMGRISGIAAAAGILAVAFVGLTSVIYDNRQNIFDFMAMSMQRLWEGIKVFTTSLGNFFARVRPQLFELARTISDTMSGVMAALELGDMEAGWDVAIQGFKVSWLQLVELMREAWRTFIEEFGVTFYRVANTIKEYYDTIAYATGTWAEAVSNVFKGTVRTVRYGIDPGAALRDAMAARGPVPGETEAQRREREQAIALEKHAEMMAQRQVEEMLAGMKDADPERAKQLEEQKKILQKMLDELKKRQEEKRKSEMDLPGMPQLGEFGGFDVPELPEDLIAPAALPDIGTSSYHVSAAVQRGSVEEFKMRKENMINDALRKLQERIANGVEVTAAAAQDTARTTRDIFSMTSRTLADLID